MLGREPFVRLSPPHIREEGVTKANAMVVIYNFCFLMYLEKYIVPSILGREKGCSCITRLDAVFVHQRQINLIRSLMSNGMFI